ncbi:MAG: N(4)-(beta-N-acetylglucosaminyl)-L-asparaginase [Bacteroidetes bacterium]|nr:N(4)-(beta-N-acetylglucosaminyl)-L-asparaginase [Bacteroidota bacterium]
MSNRRNFLKLSMLGAAATLTGEKVLARSEEEYDTVTDNPIVISTWNFGLDANKAAWKVLKSGGTALDAVEAGVRIPEADPRVNSVGYGGAPDRDGHVTLDACIMDHKYRCGSVMAIEHIMHPISVARLVMEKTPHIVLAGEGALQFALENGFKKENMLHPEAEKAWKEWLKKAEYNPVMNAENKGYHKKKDPMPGSKTNHDTIGMLAMDARGNLSGACTTSGLAYKMRGRVGDSPIIGAGLYVDNEVGAATSTGVGEEVIRIAGSHLVVELMRQGYSPEKACKKAVERIIKCNPEVAKKAQVCFLAMNKHGEHGGYALHPGFVYALRDKNTEEMMQPKHIYQE